MPSLQSSCMISF